MNRQWHDFRMPEILVELLHKISKITAWRPCPDSIHAHIHFLRKCTLLFFAAWLSSGTNCHANGNVERTVINRVLEIVSYSSVHGVKAAHELLEEQLTFNPVNRKIELQEKVDNWEGGTTDFSVWNVSPLLSENKGFFISLPFGAHQYTSKIPENGYEVLECPGSLMSNGKTILSINRTLLVTEEWSCGSEGCEFEFGFFDNTKGNIIPLGVCDIQYWEAAK